MKRNFITDDWASTFEITKKKQSWLFENDHTFSSSVGAAIEFGDFRKTHIILEGYAVSTDTAGVGVISGSGDDAMIVITESGIIDARTVGISVSGDDVEIDNRGRIEGDGSGSAIYATGDRFYFDNKGYIDSFMTITFTGDQSAVTNSEGGDIRGAIRMWGSAGETLWFNNHGLLAPPSDAISGGDSNDIIHNTGDIQGFISLGAGNDQLDTRWGTLSIARIASGSGDDTLITSDAEYLLNEAPGAGYDTVKSTVSYTLSTNVEKLELIGSIDIDGTGNDDANRLLGNKVDNILSGLGGDDILNGGRGNDGLTGGDGMDIFVFSTRHDMDTITDFVIGEDLIDLSGWKRIGSFDALERRAEDHGDDLWIVAGKDMLVIEGANLDDLDAGDFRF